MGSVSFSDMSEPRPYLVCASQRSGSTLLVESLAATGVAGRPGEFFQYFASSSLSPQPREWFAGLVDRAARHQPCAGGERLVGDSENGAAAHRTGAAFGLGRPCL